MCSVKKERKSAIVGSLCLLALSDRCMYSHTAMRLYPLHLPWFSAWMHWAVVATVCQLLDWPASRSSWPSNGGWNSLSPFLAGCIMSDARTQSVITASQLTGFQQLECIPLNTENHLASSSAQKDRAVAVFCLLEKTNGGYGVC